MDYAILDSNGICINHICWDGKSNWKPPAGCTAVPDPKRKYQIIVPVAEQAAIPEQSAAEKLAASGLTVEELKVLLGLG